MMPAHLLTPVCRPACPAAGAVAVLRTLLSLAQPSSMSGSKVEQMLLAAEALLPTPDEAAALTTARGG